MAIPKMLYVSEQTPHGPHTLDIYSRLLDDQIILLTGEINEDTAESIIAQLLYLVQYQNHLYRAGCPYGSGFTGSRSKGKKDGISQCAGDDTPAPRGRTGTGIGYRYSGKRDGKGQRTSQRNPGSSHWAAHGSY